MEELSKKQTKKTAVNKDELGLAVNFLECTVRLFGLALVFSKTRTITYLGG